MRLAKYTAGSLVVAGISATAAYAFFSIQFLIVVFFVFILTGIGPLTPSAKGGKADKVTQKVSMQMKTGTALIRRGVSGPDSLELSGDLTVTKSKPTATVTTVSNMMIAFPITKTNSAETKGSLKAGDEELSGFRGGIDNLLTVVANLGGLSVTDSTGSPGKTRRDFVGGSIQSSSSKQSGSVKVDTKTFSRLAGKVALKGSAFVSGGPNDGYDVKYKIKVKFKPRKADF